MITASLKSSMRKFALLMEGPFNVLLIAELVAAVFIKDISVLGVKGVAVCPLNLPKVVLLAKFLVTVISLL